MKRSPKQVEEAQDAAAARFRFTCHTTRVYDHLFQAGGRCEIKGCQCPTVKRVLINVCGNGFEYDVCEKHSELDGKLVESIPEERPTESIKV